MRFFWVFLVSAACAMGSGELSGRRAPGFALPDRSAKLHDPMEFFRHGAKEVFRIAVRANRLRYADQRFVSFGQQVL